MLTFRWRFGKREWFLFILVFFLTSFLVPNILHSAELFNDDLLDVHFVNDTEGWACGRWGVVVHTTDGGKSWERQRTGVDNHMSGIFFSDTNNGWVVGGEATVLHTSDGGKTWKKQQVPEEYPRNYYIFGVDFINDKKGWLCGQETYIFGTNDGGETWEIQNQDDIYKLKRISFCDELNGWSVGEYGFIYHTSDGGMTWEKQAGEFDISMEDGSIIGGNFLFDVVTIDPNTAYAVGIDSYITKTFDGGVTWERDPMPVDEKLHFFGLAMDPSSGNMVIVGKKMILTSTDGYKTFQEPSIDYPITYGWLYAVAKKGDAGYVAVGWNGRMYYSDKMGTSWTLSETTYIRKDLVKKRIELMGK